MYSIKTTIHSIISKIVLITVWQTQFQTVSNTSITLDTQLQIVLNGHGSHEHTLSTTVFTVGITELTHSHTGSTMVRATVINVLMMVIKGDNTQLHNIIILCFRLYVSSYSSCVAGTLRLQNEMSH